MYSWIVFLHVLGAFGFILSHGASAAVSLRLRTERNLERLRALLDLSTYTFNFMYGSLLLLLVAGIIAGFVGGWWGKGWIWTALALLIAIIGSMTSLGTLQYGKVRKAVGMEYMEKFKPQPALPPASAPEIDALLKAVRPELLAALGGGGLIIIVWLMMFKPF